MGKRVVFRVGVIGGVFFPMLVLLVMLGRGAKSQATPHDDVQNSADQLVSQGRQMFRFDTFGDQAFWGGMLGLHQAIEGAALGGVGPGVSPLTALAVGLKVDLDALPDNLVQQIKHGQVNLNDPAVTVALLKLNAVVGVTGIFNSSGTLQSVGIQCAFCHSTVDNFLAACPSSLQPNPGTGCIGHRLDGWPNRDLNVGAIIALAPNLQPVVDLLQTVHPDITQADVRAVLNTWGPGKFDAELFLDGNAANQLSSRSGPRPPLPDLTDR